MPRPEACSADTAVAKPRSIPGGVQHSGLRVRIIRWLATATALGCSSSRARGTSRTGPTQPTRRTDEGIPYRRVGGARRVPIALMEDGTHGVTGS
jgi:hypothetical protein